MTRHYIRLDPAFDEHKESYPDGAYAALIATFCLAEQQTERGRFRSLDYLRRVLGRRGKHVAYLLEKGDILELPDGRVYVDGWDEWQEGDWKVQERVDRIRGRRRRNGTGNGVVTPPVTVGVTHDRIDENSLSEALRSGAELGGAQTVRPLPPGFDDTPEAEAMAWLANRKCYFRSSNDQRLHRLVQLVEKHGSDAVIRTFEFLAKAGMEDGDAAGFVFKAEDALRGARPSAKRVHELDEADQAKREHERGLQKTRDYMAWYDANLKATKEKPDAA